MGRSPGNSVGISSVPYRGCLQLRTMRFECEKASVKWRADLQTAQTELAQLQSEEPPDEKQVVAKIREVFAKVADMAVAALGN